MSAALQLPTIWASLAEAAWSIETRQEGKASSSQPVKPPAAKEEPQVSLAFYRRHTESLLRRYLYASVQVGRAPSLLSAPVGRGWASSRPVRSFEDAVIFVLDVERCLNRLETLDQQLLSRIVLQEYTHQETAAMLGMCVRTVSSRLAKALDRLTEHLLATGLLILPD
jgi:hypothetical protein